MTDQTIAELAPVIGTRAECAAVGRSRATYYRYHRQSPPSPRPSRERERFKENLRSPDSIGSTPTPMA